MTSIFILSSCSTPTPVTVDPDITFQEQEFDFGLIKQSGGIVTHDFLFKYEGETPINITGTPASCACTSGTVDKTVLLPGESAVLKVAFNPNLHAEPKGRFYKSVLILTEPAINPTPEVKIWQEINLDLGPEAFELQAEHVD